MKKIIIIGGGNVGYHLAKILVGKNYDIRLVEKKKERCTFVADMLDIPTYCGDGSSITTLKRAGVSDMDIFIAVTGQDQDNFVAAQLAKQYFNVKRVIAKSNNPKNAEAMEKFSADVVVSEINIITGLLLDQVEKE